MEIKRLDFDRVRNKEISYNQLTAGLTVVNLKQLTNDTIDRQLSLIKGCSDDDVVFVPDDPAAKDTAAATAEEFSLAWTLGHVIVHATASSEEAAFIAAELARGVPYREGRSRSEVHWTTVTSIDQCTSRLEESRRMRLASLEMWPESPSFENSYVSPRTGITIGPVIRFVLGLAHDDDHLGQISEIVRQAHQARS